MPAIGETPAQPRAQARHACNEAARPAVSVIVVHWNTPRELETCLAALPAAMGELSYEIVVADNASALLPEMDSLAVLPLTWLPCARNLGFAAAANSAVAYARAPRLLFLNPDARLDGNCVPALVRALERERLGAVAPLARDAAGNTRFPGFNFLDPLNHAVALLGADGMLPRRRRRAAAADGAGVIAVDWLRASALMIASKVFAALGGFDERYFLYEEDEDLCWRLRRRGYRVAVCTDATMLDPGAAATAAVADWAEFALHREQLAFMRRRGGAAAGYAYRLLALGALALKYLLAGRDAASRRFAAARMSALSPSSRLHRAAFRREPPALVRSPTQDTLAARGMPLHAAECVAFSRWNRRFQLLLAPSPRRESTSRASTGVLGRTPSAGSAELRAAPVMCR